MLCDLTFENSTSMYIVYRRDRTTDNFIHWRGNFYYVLDFANQLCRGLAKSNNKDNDNDNDNIIDNRWSKFNFDLHICLYRLGPI